MSSIEKAGRGLQKHEKRQGQRNKGLNGGNPRPPMAGQKRKLEEEEEDLYGRALRRMEMGPGGMGDDSDDIGSDGGPGFEEDWSGSDDEEPQQRVQAGRKGVAGGKPQAASAGLGLAARIIGGRHEVDEEDGEDDDSDEAVSEEGIGAGRDEEDEEDSGSGGDEEEEDDEEKLLEQQLQEVPLGMRLEARVDGTGPSGLAAREAARQAKEKEKGLKRANKHRPREASAKRPVPRLREVVEPTARPGRDPRFDSGRVASQAEKDVAARRYAFVYDDVLAKERTQLKARLKREGANNPRLEASLRNQLQRVEGALRTEEARRRRAKVEESVKAKQREASAEGKGPFYLKKSDKKKMELVAKYEELKSAGRLDRFMEKRRRKNASKDHRYLPSARRDADV